MPILRFHCSLSFYTDRIDFFPELPDTRGNSSQSIQITWPSAHELTLRSFDYEDWPKPDESAEGLALARLEDVEFD